MSARKDTSPDKGDNKYARGDEQGRFIENQDSAGKSLPAGRRIYAKALALKRHGDRKQN